MKSMLMSLVVCFNFNVFATTTKVPVIKVSKDVIKKVEKKKAQKNPVVIMETSKGVIHLELFQKKAPISVKNFLSYVNKKFYDNTIFHRVINNFMIQGILKDN